jgi:hypothetical protein
VSCRFCRSLSVDWGLGIADAEREHILGTLNQTDWLIGGQDGAANRPGCPYYADL